MLAKTFMSQCLLIWLLVASSSATPVPEATSAACAAVADDHLSEDEASLVQIRRAQTATQSNTESPPEAEEDTDQDEVSDDNLLPELEELGNRMDSMCGEPGCSGDLPEQWMAYTKAREIKARRMVLHGVPMKTCNGSCPMAAMSGPTYVFPLGGDTGCLDGSDFAFAVSPGRTDKLLFYFQGGGACWDAFSYTIGACTQSLTGAMQMSGLMGGQGVFNKSHNRNNFQDYTIVEVLYCSGDAHVGNTSHRAWDLSRPLEKVRQLGFNNALAAFEWTRSNLVSHLDELTISGDSAGALGTQAWTDYIIHHIKAKSSVSLIDSYVGYFPPGTEGPTLQNFGTCDLPLWTPKEQRECSEGTLEVEGFMIDTMKANPSIPFAFIQSKGDIVQRIFYSLIALTLKKEAVFLDANEFYTDTNGMFQDYNGFKNFVVYYVQGCTHTFTELDYYYTAGTRGPGTKSSVNPFDPLQAGCYSWGGSPKGMPTMSEWVNKFYKNPGNMCPMGHCWGRNMKNGGHGGMCTKYCDRGLYPKTCVI